MKTVNLNNVSKSYNGKIVIDSINYEFESGKCYLILGSNGAGKSTLLYLIMNLIYPNVGNVNLNNLCIGYVPDKNILPMNITIYRFLNIITEIKKDNILNVVMLMKYFDIYKEKMKKINQLSKGMIQKILIIQAFIGNPDILIFDEALNGLDVKMQNKLINLINKKKKENKIILITSHYPSYYQDVIDYRLNIENGKIN